MKKHSKEAEWKERPNRTVGVDLGDRFSRYCVLNEDGGSHGRRADRNQRRGRFGGTGKASRVSAWCWKPERTRLGSAVCSGVSAIR